MFEKQCGYQANRTGVGPELLVSLYFVILISLSHTDLVAMVVVIKKLHYRNVEGPVWGRERECSLRRVDDMTCAGIKQVS